MGIVQTNIEHLARFTVTIQASLVARSQKLLSVWLTQLVKTLAAPTHVRSLCARGPGSIPVADKLDSE